jgi:TetR/AcrR family transcriptional regulator
MTTEDAAIHKERLILASARKRFAYFGFSKVTMDEIAADCGMAKASLYYYYPNKERLFEEVIIDEQRHFLRDMEDLLGQDTHAPQKLHEYVGRRFQLFRELINLGSLGGQNWREMKSLFEHLLRNLEAQELKLVQHILDSGVSAGDFTIESPQRTARLLLHVLQGLRLRALHNGHEPGGKAYSTLREEMVSCVEFFLNGIRKHSSSTT